MPSSSQENELQQLLFLTENTRFAPKNLHIHQHSPSTKAPREGPTPLADFRAILQLYFKLYESLTDFCWLRRKKKKKAANLLHFNIAAAPQWGLGRSKIFVPCCWLHHKLRWRLWLKHWGRRSYSSSSSKQQSSDPWAAVQTLHMHLKSRYNANFSLHITQHNHKKKKKSTCSFCKTWKCFLKPFSPQVLSFRVHFLFFFFFYFILCSLKGFFSLLLCHKNTSC